MPVVDKPLHELVKFTTTTPRPADFDAFWAKGLAELDGLDPKVTYTIGNCFGVTSRA